MTRSRRPPSKRPRASETPDLPAEVDAEPAVLPRRATVLVDLAIMIGTFVMATVVAELAGAENLGTSLSVGQITFALAAFYVFMRR